jgi:hypothetical protein
MRDKHRFFKNVVNDVNDVSFLTEWAVPLRHHFYLIYIKARSVRFVRGACPLTNLKS